MKCHDLILQLFVNTFLFSELYAILITYAAVFQSLCGAAAQFNLNLFLIIFIKGWQFYPKHYNVDRKEDQFTIKPLQDLCLLLSFFWVSYFVH